MTRISNEVTIDWDEATVHAWAADPNGPLGEVLLRQLAEIVLAGARRRALRRTGRMADAMTYEITHDEMSGNLVARVISPATDPRSHNFPYPIVHEGKRVRDRRPHRSLRPALRDIRHSVYVDDVGDESKV